MLYTREMLCTYPGSVPIVAAALVGCKGACLDCAQSCSAYADACLGEQGVEQIRRYITMCLN